uniref:Baseplate protein n=1 Tax=Siphoviridae sp. ctiOl67 TaxID=2825622 RepID=A0A8S5QK63_9CAUD|nr:MAG TPA: baseplate protein [Siphoviridae sp. ctiOl67]
MKDYTISESFTLPSKGLIYDTKFDPIVTIHSMQTRHEMMRLSPGEYPYKSLCDIIDDCMVNDIPISSYDMFFGDYQYLLYKLRTVTYGKEYKLSVTCPICGETYEGSIDLDELEVLDNVDSFNNYLEFDLPYSKKHVVLNY